MKIDRKNNKKNSRKAKVHFTKNFKKNKKPQKYDEEITSEEESIEETVEKSEIKQNFKENIVEEREAYKQHLEKIKQTSNDEIKKLKLLSKNINLNCFNEKLSISTKSTVSCIVVSNITHNNNEHNFNISNSKINLTNIDKNSDNNINMKFINNYDKNNFLIVGLKDGWIIKYSFSGQKLSKIKSHNKNSKATGNKKEPKGSIICMALSSDNRFLVTSSQDNVIFIWLTENLTYYGILTGHRGCVRGLSFQMNTYQLFSCAVDRMVKIWNVEKIGYIDTLYGHDSEIYWINSLDKERAVTCANDSTIRMWKIHEQSQLVFNTSNSQSCVSMINQKYFISGGFDGSLNLWSIGSKKPLFTLKNIHTSKDEDPVISSSNSKVYEISALAVFPYSDIVATGSYDGYVKIFAISLIENYIKFVRSIKIDGHVNCMSFFDEGHSLIIGCGTEQRLGRWVVIKNRQVNKISIYNL